MTDHLLRKLARGLLGASLLLIAASFILIVIGWGAAYAGWGFRGFPSLLAIPFAATGFLILTRLPRHGIGWVFLVLGLASSLQGLLYEYMLFSLVLYPDVLPGGLQVAWFLELYWVLTIFLLALILILFPSGSPPTPRWRKYIWFTAVILAIFSGLMAVTPGPMESSFVSLENPYSLDILPADKRFANAGAVLIMLIAFGLPVLNLFKRFLRAEGVVRQQYKWFVYAAFIILLTSIMGGTSANIGLQLLFLFSISLLPVALTVAVLRYRLFDIDIIIRRTLSYAVLTAVLAASYFGGVVLLQSVFGSLSAGSSPLITVISTLVIAALFNPLRTRIQSFIDRRFYRAKYDAELTLKSFATTARDEVDIQRLSQAMLRVIEQTLQPEQAHLLLTEMDGVPEGQAEAEREMPGTILQSRNR